MRLLFSLGLGLAFFASAACSSTDDVPAAGADSGASTGDAAIGPGSEGGDGGSSGGDGASDGSTTAKSSGGSGGLACTSRGNLPAGRTYCVATEGGSEIKLAEPTGGNGPLSIMLYLHGDGAAAHKSDSAMKTILPFADTHRALVVSVLSPNGCAWWQAPTQTDCTDTATPVPDADGVNADTLAAVLTKIRSAYDVTNGPVFYYGSSGGSVFLTRSFLRRFGDRYPGAFALNCGGEANDKPFSWDVADAAKRGSSKLYFTYGDQDFLKPDIEAAITQYGSLGFVTDAKVIPGATHCAFDGHGRAVEVWKTFLGE